MNAYSTYKCEVPLHLGLIKDNYLDIVYVKSEDNYANLITKNVSKDVYDRLFASGI